MSKGELAVGAGHTTDVESKGLKGGALGLVSSIVVGMASTAPAYSLAATLGLVVASGVAGMVQHAAGEYVSAGENFGAAVALVVGQGEDPRGAARLETQRDHLVAPALKQVCVICGGGVVVC